MNDILDTKPTPHTHDAARFSPAMPFRGPIPGADENRAAHGCISIIQVCSCGAARAVNVNGGERETGPWQETDR